MAALPARSPEVQGARVFSASQLVLPGLSYKAFLYPGEEDALSALKKVPGAPTLLTYLQENFTEQLVLAKNTEQMIRAGESSFPTLHRLVARCAEILSVTSPELYLTTSPELRAYTVGHRRACLVLHSALVEGMTADELSFVIGRELGHIKCGHGLYLQLGEVLARYWDAVSSLIPIQGLAQMRIPLLLAYWEWRRRAELTCDRAGVLCVQAADPAYSALGKLAGKVQGLEEFDVDSAISQVDTPREVSKLALVASILDSGAHPFVPRRLKELRSWWDGEAYHRILDGQFERDPLFANDSAARMRCACGVRVNSASSFCPECGRRVGSEPPPPPPPPAPPRPSRPQPPPVAMSAPCPRCGRPVAPSFRYCTGCGSRLQ